MLKQFKAESKRLLDLMINSIYTNREIFLRELISNASDAMDKLHFMSLTDSNASREFEIRLETDAKNRIVRIVDNGIGMSSEELEANLGTIAKSGTLDFKKEKEKDAEQLIGQFGVGFYSCFMVADEVIVTSKKYGEDKAFVWTSKGVNGYSIKPAEKDQSGTVVQLKLKEDSDDCKYSDYLNMDTLTMLVKKYSDYIRYPIKAMVEDFEPKEGGEEKVITEEVLNSMIPIWKKKKSDVTAEEHDAFYSETFRDFEKPLKVISAKVEGNVDYTALLFIPSRAPHDYYAKEFKGGLRLYSNGVLIMENCEKLLPDYLMFVRGIVDSADLSLNISREMLQHDRQLTVIANSIEKKLLSELGKMLADNREDYEKFFKQFGLTMKFGGYNGFGAKMKDLQDLFIFFNTDGEKYVTLKEYVSSMKEGQKDIYYASGSDVRKLGGLPQVTAIKNKGYGVLLLSENIDEFVIKIISSYDGKNFVSALGGKLDLGDEKSEAETKKEQAKPLLDEMKKVLDGKVSEVRLSGLLGDFASGLSASGEISFEMAKVLSSMPGAEKIKADMVLEINPEHTIYKKAERLLAEDGEKFARLTKLLYEEAQLTLGNSPENPSELVKLINEFAAD